MAEQTNKPAEETVAPAEGAVEGAAPAAATARKRKGKKNISTGVVYITATFNNTIVSVADASGNVVAWSSAGAKGFRGSRKNTPFAAQVAAEDAVRKAVEHGLRSVAVEVKGPGAGRESALRGITAGGIRVSQIKDTTPVPHNGCRPPKRRRV
jgi:small subunit ribosomal protein S11